MHTWSLPRPDRRRDAVATSPNRWRDAVATYAAAIDQGTTGTRFMIFGHEGQVIASAYREHKQIYPQPGWVEHDALEIWDVTRHVMSAAFQESGIQPQELLGIGVANQRETTVVWDRTTGRPLYNAIVWQCTRTRDICQTLIAQGLEPTIRERTGLVVATYFSGPKIKWILDNVPGVREKAEKRPGALWQHRHLAHLEPDRRAERRCAHH